MALKSIIRVEKSVSRDCLVACVSLVHFGKQVMEKTNHESLNFCCMNDTDAKATTGG